MSFFKNPHVSLFTIAFLVRLALILTSQFDGLYGQDAYAYFHQSLAIAENLPHGILPPPDFFWPNGYPLLAAAAIWVVGKIPFAAVLVNLLAGAVLAPLTYSLCVALWRENRMGHRTGLLAGFLIAFSGQLVLSSVLVMADVAALFWAVLGARLLAGVWDKSATDRYHLARLALSAGALGMAIVTRWIYALLAVPFVAYSLYRWQQRRAPIWHFVVPTAVGLGVILPQIGLSLNQPEGIFHSWLVGWRPWNAFGTEFTHVDGSFSYTVPVGLYYLQPAGHPNYLFPTFGLTALSGLWSVWRARKWSVILLLGGWLFVVYGFLAGIPYENFRFGMTMHPPLVLLAAYGTIDLLDRATNAGWKNLIWVGTIISLLGMIFWAMGSSCRFIKFHQEQKDLARQIGAAVPPEATLLAFDLTLTLQQYTDLEVAEFYGQNESLLADQLAEHQPLYLLIDLEQTRTQWLGKPPDVNFRWLTEHARLEDLSKFGSFTLYRVMKKDP